MYIKGMQWLAMTIVLGVAGLGIQPMAVAATATDTDAAEGTTDIVDVAAHVKNAADFAAGLVRVEVTLQFDKADAPDGVSVARRCPNCGQFHSYEEGPRIVEEQRPLEGPGYLVSPKLVLTPDIMIHPRFVKAIAVRFGDHVVKATPARYAKDEPAMFLKLAEPLEGARPIPFVANGTPPFLLLSYDRSEGQWKRTLRAAGLSSVVVDEDGQTYYGLQGQGILMTRDGKAVGMLMNQRLKTDGSWQGSPLRWPHWSAEEYAGLHDRIARVAEQGLLRVKLNFRSPKTGDRSSRFRRYMMDFNSEQDSPTELNTVGVVVEGNRVLIVAKLDATTTARLERITVFGPDGQAVEAKFAGTLENYGALLARLEKPVGRAVRLREDSILNCRDVLLMAADIEVQGEHRVQYVGRERMAGFAIGWRGQIYPQGFTRRERDKKRHFIFDEQGRLVTLPVSWRRKLTGENIWYSSYDTAPTAAMYLAGVIADPTNHLDASNVPLSEAEESRVAWLGVELQALTPELARLNGVSHLTNNGQTGAVISYVYPDSPAAKVGIEQGAILLYLGVPDRLKPIAIELDEDMGFFLDEFPWEQLEQIPFEMMSELPRPWPSVENVLARHLGEIGFGKPYTAVLFQDGQQVEKSLVVEQSPPHYDSAPRHKSEVLGLTVRNLTYETRRYFQRAENDPGVIVSKIEPGSKAAVAGIKPYEIITHINDEPVASVEDFKRLIEQADELRFSVKRMTKGRLVRIRK